MAFRRNDARRRRLVNDPSAQGIAVEPDGVGSPVAPSLRRQSGHPDARTYSYGADRRNQLKTTDLIPKRAVAYLLVVLALLTFIWLINFTSVHAERWSARIGNAAMDALSIGKPGSLAEWFNSFLLILTGLTCLQIYALRQHRCDDYRGTYRMWLWMAGLMILCSIHCVTNLGTLATNLIQSATRDSMVAKAWVPVAFELLALAVLMGRAVYEVRDSRGSLALVVFVWIAYSFAGVLQLPVMQESLVGYGVDTLVGNSILLGTTALFLAHLTYARYIFLDAHGLIVHRLKTAKAAKTEQAAKPKATKKKKPARKNGEPAASKTQVSPVTTTANVEWSDSGAAKSPIVRSPKKSRESKPVPVAQVKPHLPEKQSAPRDRSPSDVLRELAAASRAKEQTRVSSAPTDAYDEEEEGVLPMSKAQKRKQRKLEKQKRRAA